MLKMKDGYGYIIPDEWAIKIEKFERIEKLLKERDPYHDNRGTNIMIRKIIEGDYGENDE